MVALTGHHRVKQVAEGVRVLDAPHCDLSLQSPQPDLHGVARFTTVPSR